MATMTKSWTDERLEERFDRIDDRFDDVGRRFDEVDQRFDRVEGDLRELRVDVKAGFERMDGRFEAMHRLIIQMLVTLVVGFAGVIATLATQL